MSSSIIRQFTARAMYPIRETPLAVTGDVVEATATGALTGHLEAKNKLDFHLKSGKKVPMDLTIGVLGSYASTFMATPHFVRRAADRLTAIAAHRISKNYTATGKFHGDEISDGLNDAGIAGADPILQAAAGL
jgi:hypothetical protein